MKKALLLLTMMIYPLFAGAQFCVTIYKGDDFGLDDVESMVHVLEIDSSGNAWFGLRNTCGNGAVGVFRDEAWTTVAAARLPDPRSYAITFCKNDSVWIGTFGGIAILHIDNLEGRMMTVAGGNLPEDRVTALVTDSVNNKWAGFNSGRIARYNGTAWEEFTAISTESVKDIAIAKNGDIWAGFTGAPGLVRNTGSGFTTIPGFNAVQAISTDKWGRVLVASHDSVVIHSAMGTLAVKAASGNVIRDVTVGGGGGVWASSGQGILYKRQDRFLRFSNNNSGVPSNLSHPIEFNQNNDLWFGFTYVGAASMSFAGTAFIYRIADPPEDIVTSSEPSMEFCWGDSIVLTADPTNTSYVWPDGSSALNTYIIYDGSEEIPIAVEGDNRCYYYDTLTATVQRVYEDEEICVANVDTAQKVILIWERTAEVGTASYNIYREEATDVYEFMDNVPVGQLSVWQDPTADPYARAYRYKITAVDTCQNESDESFYHQTLHLAASEGNTAGDVELHWNFYEGIDVAQYIIFRGEDTLNLDSIATVPGTVQDYTDVEQFDTVYYKIGFRLPQACDPTVDGGIKAGAGPYHHGLSNLDKNRLSVFVAPPAHSPEVLNAWPNPMTDRSRIEFPTPLASPYEFRLYGPGGRLVRQTQGISSGEFFIERGSLRPGFYLFELKGENNYRGRIVVQ